jgi:hypothetical protein
MLRNFPPQSHLEHTNQQRHESTGMDQTECILANYHWEQVPEPIRKQLNNSKDIWNARVRKVCIENCVRWADSVVKEVMKEQDYYVQMLENQLASLRVRLNCYNSFVVYSFDIVSKGLSFSGIASNFCYLFIFDAAISVSCGR